MGRNLALSGRIPVELAPCGRRGAGLTHPEVKLDVARVAAARPPSCATRRNVRNLRLSSDGR